jgi:hypothetical protein
MPRLCSATEEMATAWNRMSEGYGGAHGICMTARTSMWATNGNGKLKIAPTQRRQSVEMKGAVWEYVCVCATCQGGGHNVELCCRALLVTCLTTFSFRYHIYTRWNVSILTLGCICSPYFEMHLWYIWTVIIFFKKITYISSHATMRTKSFHKKLTYRLRCIKKG